MTTEKKESSMKEYLERNLPARIKEILPKELDLKRFMRISFAALVRTPDLAECVPLSVIDSLIKCSECGVEPDSRMAYLVPFKQYDKNGKYLRTNCTFILGYMGMVQIARRTGEVADIQCEVVRAKDEFDYEFGTNKFLRHRPFDGAGDRGEITHVWSFVNFVNGFSDFRVWRKDRIEEARARSKAKDRGPWVTDPESMAMKALFRYHFKWLPFSSETMRKAMNDDDDVIDVESTVVPQRRLRAPSHRAAFADTEGFSDMGSSPDTTADPDTKTEPDPDSSQKPGEEPQDTAQFQDNPFDQAPAASPSPSKQKATTAGIFK